MKIGTNPKPKFSHFTISGRSTGGTAKMEHITEAYNAYKREFGVSSYVSIIIYLEDGAVPLNKYTAKAIVRGYKRAAKKLEDFVRSQGNPHFSLNMQFIKI